MSFSADLPTGGPREVAVSLQRLPSREQRARATVVPRIAGGKLTAAKTIAPGRVPEGAGFASDGRHLCVVNVDDKELWVFPVESAKVTATGKRFAPGRPASAPTSPGKPLAAESGR